MSSFISNEMCNVGWNNKVNYVKNMYVIICIFKSSYFQPVFGLSTQEVIVAFTSIVPSDSQPTGSSEINIWNCVFIISQNICAG